MKNRNEKVYTLVFIIISAVFTSTVLLYYSYLLEGLIPQSNLIREYLICFGQLAFQGILLVVAKQSAEHILLYFKNMMTVSLIGGLLLLPLLIISNFFQINTFIYLGYFFVVVLFMFFDHKRRVKNIGSPWWLTYTWVLYRFIVLLIIL